MTNTFSYDTLHTKSRKTISCPKKQISADVRRKWRYKIMDMFSFLNNGILLCLLNSGKRTESENEERDEYDY